MITLVNQLAVSVVVTVDSVGIGDHTSPRCPVDVDDLTDSYSIHTWHFCLSVRYTGRHSWSNSRG